MLLPKRVKYRRVHRGRMTGKATRGNTIAYGEFGLQAELTVGNGVAAGGLAGHTAAVYAAILDSLRQKHYWAPPSLAGAAGAAGRALLTRLKPPWGRP